MSNSRQRSFGIILQYFQMAISIILQLIYTPFMLRTLGKNEYGIYNLASSTISYLSLLSLGFGASYLRYYSLYKKDSNEEGIRRLNGLYLSVFLLIGFISLICGFVLVENVSILFNETYSGDEIQTAKILMEVLTINLAISFPASVFSSFVTSQEKFIFQKILNMGKTIASPILGIVILSMGYGSIGMVVITTLVAVVVDFINIYYCFVVLKMGVSFRNPDFRLFKDIFIFSFFIAINQIIDQINWQTDKLILGKMINGTAVAVYAVGSQINTMFTQFSTAISSVFAPKVNRIVCESSSETVDSQLTDLFIRVGRLQWFMLMLILSGFIFFGEYFIKRWAGVDYGNAYWVALVLMIPAIIPLIQNVGLEIQRAKNKHQFRSIVYLIMAVLNVGMSIWFVSMWGEIGAAIGTNISLVVANGIIMNIYYQKKLGINVVSFWKSILSTIPSLIIPSLIGVMIMIFYSYKGLVDFILFILLYAVIFMLFVVFFGLNKNEKMQLKMYSKRLFYVVSKNKE